MSIHPLFTRPRPTAIPALYADTMDDLLSERRFSDEMADRALKKTKLDYWFAARQGDFSHRLNARIAQVAK